MNTTTSCTDMLDQLRTDRDQTEQRLAVLRSGIAAFEKLTDPTGITKQPRRTKTASSGADVPTELASLGTKERILHVTTADPTKKWTIQTIAVATHVASISSVRTTVTRLVTSGELAHNPNDQTYTATAPTI